MTDATTPCWAERLLAFEALGEQRYRSHHPLNNRAGSIFGGQPLGQVIAAAQHTVPGWRAHSLSGNFLRAGRLDVPVDYAVESVRDGRRFASRRVVASQDGKPMFDGLCSFHDPEPGFSHQYAAMGEVPAPETLPDLPDFVEANRSRMSQIALDVYLTPFPIALRLTDPEASLFGEPGSHRNAYWFRMACAGSITDPAGHQALLAFMSDFWLAGSVGAPHSVRRGEPGFSVVSLTHAMWFHAPARADDWLLYRAESPWAGEGRGLVRGFIHDRAGILVATVVQEVSVRSRRPNPEHA